MLLYLAFKNIVSRKSSFVIVAFIAFSIMMMTAINSLFDSTEQGVRQVYSRTFTGDIVIRPHSKMALSLFGDETPVTGKLSKIDLLVPYNNIVDSLEENPSVEKFCPQVSGRAEVIVDSEEMGMVSLFGVPGGSYAECMSSISILEGKPYADGERGAMITEARAKELGISVGDKITFGVADGNTFRLREVPVTAIYSYPIENETLEKIILADPFTLRSLLDISDSVEQDLRIAEEKTDMLGEDFDMDSLFDNASDMGAVRFEDFAEPELEDENSSLMEFKTTAWNFIVVCLKDGVDSKRALRDMNREFKRRGWEINAVSWRTASGSTSLYLYWMRIIFNAGVIIILAAGFIIINNTLVVNVLNRRQEIGTLRAQGASRAFVSLQCMCETLMLAVTAGIAGCALGALLSFAISSLRIEFGNSFLVQLFGTEILSFSASFSVILRSMELSVLIGLLGWIYPVRAALSVSPVQAMQGAS